MEVPGFWTDNLDELQKALAAAAALRFDVSVESERTTKGFTYLVTFPQFQFRPRRDSEV